MRQISCCGIRLPRPVAQISDAPLSQSDIRRLYDAIAPVYDLWGLLTESRARKRALQLVDLHDDERILEVAVGTGLMFRSLVARNPNGRNVGIDISEGMLAKARRRLRRVRAGNHELRVASAFDLPFPDRSFDLLVNCYMFDLLPFEQMGRALNEFHRVLEDGAHLLMINMTTPETIAAGLYESISRRHPRLLGGCRGVRLAERLAERGFEVIRREYLQQFLFPSEVILARKCRQPRQSTV